MRHSCFRLAGLLQIRSINDFEHFFALNFFQSTSNPFLVPGSACWCDRLTGTITLLAMPRSILIFPSFFFVHPNTRALVRSSLFELDSVIQSVLLINSCGRLTAHRAHRATVALNCTSKFPLIDRNHGSPSGIKQCRTSIHLWYQRGCKNGMLNTCAPRNGGKRLGPFLVSGRGALAGGRLGRNGTAQVK